MRSGVAPRHHLNDSSVVSIAGYVLAGRIDMRTICGVFSGQHAAEIALAALKDAGIPADAMTIETPDDGVSLLVVRVEDDMAEVVHAGLHEAGAESAEESDSGEDAAAAEQDGLGDPSPIAPVSR